MLCAEAEMWLISILFPLLQFSWGMHWSQSAWMQHGLQAHGNEGEGFWDSPCGVWRSTWMVQRSQCCSSAAWGGGCWAEQDKEERPTGFACSHPSQQGYTGMEGAEIYRSELTQYFMWFAEQTMPHDLPQKVDKAQVRSASPNQDASLPTSRI